MSDEPIEDSTFDFLEEKILAAPTSEILHGLELRDTLFKKIKDPSGIGIGDGESDFAPDATDEMQEFDALLMLVIYSKIEDANKTERRAARGKAWRIAKVVAKLIKDDDTMGGRVCGARCLTANRGFDSINGQPYAVVNMPIVFNESGEINFNNRRNY